MRKILIVGAGQAGLQLANGLAQNGYDVTVVSNRTPEQIREFCLRFEESGVDQLIFVMQAGKNQHEHICEAIEMFGKEVLPEFKERDEALVAKKAKRLEPVIEQAMARKVDTAPKMPEDYTMKAIPKAMIDASQNDEGKQFLEKFAKDRAEAVSKALGEAGEAPVRLGAITARGAEPVTFTGRLAL